MIKLSIKHIAEILDAKLIDTIDIEVENVSTDSRQKTDNGLFFALKGETFDAHDYLQDAIAQGAIAVVVEHLCHIQAPQIIVEDTRIALGKLAKWLHAKINPLTVAVTGSSGKTTVKEMSAAILQRSAVKKDTVLFTQGNFNNDIGVPLTLLRLCEQHRFAVIELGANHQGEIAYTTNLVCPHVALITNVAAAHLEGFGSIEGVAKAKGEIYQGLQPDGIALINLDCHYLSIWQQVIDKHPIQTFSVTNTDADYYAESIRMTESGTDFILHSPQGEIEINLPSLGEHNISNALAAAALTMNVGAHLQDIKQGLEYKSQVKGRLFPIQVCENLLLLDDTYNANVASLQSAIKVLQKYSAFRILVVGDIAELGENSSFCHRQVAEFAQQAKLDLVVSFGEESKVISNISLGTHFTNKAKLIAFLADVVQKKLQNKQKVVLLAKGSRVMKMEEVIYSLKDKFLC